LLPWPDEKGAYSLQYVPIHSLKDRQKVHGDVAHMSVNPSIRGDSYRAEDPKARLAKISEGKYVPEDTTTTALYTVYAHTERLQELERQLGLQDLIPYPRKIGVEVNVRIDGEKEDNNGFYLGELDVTIYSRYSLNKLSTAFNAGLIAHEHFHAIFWHLVSKDLDTQFIALDTRNMDEEVLQKKALKIHRSNLFYLRAYNEGLADLWANIYTGQDRFLNKSLSKNKDNPFRDFHPGRSLYKYQNKKMKAYKAHDLMLSKKEKYQPGAEAYRHGFHIAYLLRSKMLRDLNVKLAASSKESGKLLMAEYVINFLYKLRKMLKENLQYGLDENDILPLIYEQDNKEDCKVVKNIAPDYLQFLSHCYRNFPDLEENEEPQEVKVKLIHKVNDGQDKKEGI